jgi:hypothetical protein
VKNIESTEDHGKINGASALNEDHTPGPSPARRGEIGFGIDF